MLAKLRADAARIRLCSHIQCIATSVPFRRPRRPTARGFKPMHVHAHAPCPLSCAAARAPAIPTAHTHLPSGTPSHRSASPVRSDMRQWNRRYARTRHAHRRRARTGCNPREHLCQCKRSTLAGPRMQPAREPAAAHHGSGRATPTARANPPGPHHPPACPRTAHWRGVRRPRVCAYQTEEPNVGGGGGGKDSVKIRESLFCLLSIRGNTVQASDLHPKEVSRPTRVVRSCTGFQDDHGDRQLGRGHARS